MILTTESSLYPSYSFYERSNSLNLGGYNGHTTTRAEVGIVSSVVLHLIF